MRTRLLYRSVVADVAHGPSSLAASVEELKKHTLRPLYGHQNMETFIRQVRCFVDEWSTNIEGEPLTGALSCSRRWQSTATAGADRPSMSRRPFGVALMCV
jgi:hypothetical protein